MKVYPFYKTDWDKYKIRITSKFGSRKDPATGKIKWHYGTDYAPIVKTGELRIIATDNGTLRIGSNPKLEGNYFLLTSDDGFTYYGGHLEKHLRGNGRINRGDVIGLMGSTGYSTGKHLHFEVRTGKTGAWTKHDPEKHGMIFIDNLNYNDNEMITLPKTIMIKIIKNGNLRQDATSQSGDLGDVKAGETYVCNSFARGENVSGVDLWYKTDRGWIWGGLVEILENYQSECEKKLSEITKEVAELKKTCQDTVNAYEAKLNAIQLDLEVCTQNLNNLTSEYEKLMEQKVLLESENQKLIKQNDEYEMLYDFKDHWLYKIYLILKKIK